MGVGSRVSKPYPAMLTATEGAQLLILQAVSASSAGETDDRCWIKGFKPNPANLRATEAVKLIILQAGKASSAATQASIALQFRVKQSCDLNVLFCPRTNAC
jgi:hypothetical protein